MIVLTAGEHKYVLENKCPQKPSAEEGTDKEWDDYSWWTRSDELARCYILASLDTTIQRQVEAMKTASEMMEYLAAMFEGRSRVARYRAARALFNTKMIEGTPVRDHLLKLMGFLTELGTYGVEVDPELQIDIFLASLPDCFDNFVNQFNLNKLTMGHSDFLAAAVAAEEGIKSKGTSLNTEHFLKPKGRIQKKSYHKGQTSSTGQKNKDKKDKPKGKCFNCGKPGHWKRDCRLKGESKMAGKLESHVVETLMSTCSPISWVLDSGSTNHVCNSLQGFRRIRNLSEGEVMLSMGTNAQASAKSVGDVLLYFSDNRCLVLNNVLYVPSFRRNLISVSCLVNNGMNVSFEKSVVIQKENAIVCTGRLQSGLYIITPSLEEKITDY